MHNTPAVITCTAMSSDGLDALIAQGDLRDHSKYIRDSANWMEYYLEEACRAELANVPEAAEELLGDALKREHFKRSCERKIVAYYYEMHAHGARSYESLDQPTWRGWHRRYGFITICEPSLVDYRRIDHLIYEHEMEE